MPREARNAGRKAFFAAAFPVAARPVSTFCAWDPASAFRFAIVASAADFALLASAPGVPTRSKQSFQVSVSKHAQDESAPSGTCASRKPGNARAERTRAERVKATNDLLRFLCSVIEFSVP